MIGFIGCNQTNTTASLTELETTEISTSLDLTTEEVSTSKGIEIVDIEMGYIHSIALSSEGVVFTWGNNEEGQLGDNTVVSSSTPVNITSFFELSNGEKIIDVDAGHFHSMALSSNHRLFIWGLTLFDFLDGPNVVSFPLAYRKNKVPVDITEELELNQGENIIKMDSGAGQLLILTSEHRLISWGINHFGEVGGQTDDGIVYPIDITPFIGLIEDEYIEDISLGYYHSSAITSMGRIFIWGLNNLGQLGDWSTINKKLPVEITPYFILDDDEKLIDVTLGFYHSSAMSSKGKVFTWGYNGFGQTGQNNEDDEYVFHPMDITDYFDLNEDDEINHVYLGGWHSYGLTQNGQIYAWGFALDGRLGFNFNQNLYKPTPLFHLNDLEEGESIIAFDLGAWTSSMLTSYGRCFVWGYNEDGRLGLGSTENVHRPEEILFHTNGD